VLIAIDDFTTLNTDVPILLLDDVSDEEGKELTRIVFAIADLDPVITSTPRGELVELLVKAEQEQIINPPGMVFPNPGEDTVDYLNRITP
jgi:hypothetical protein